MSRWFRFLIAVAIGGLAGLYYGWVLNPVEYVDTAPDTLRMDYRTDYVLMVAEAYRSEADLPLAVRRLAQLGDDPPAEIVAKATLYAVDQDYPESDLGQMQALANALQGWNPSIQVPPK